MNILVTGASGFIGGRFLQRFATNSGCVLYGVGRRPGQNVPAGALYAAVPLDRLGQLDFTPDVVIHAAGRASPWGTRKEYWRDNVQSTQQVVSFCQQQGLPRLIFLSTAAVYYRFAHQHNLLESQPVGPEFTSEYGHTKYQAEMCVAGYPGEKTVLRPCAVFGEGDQLLFPPLLAAARNKRLYWLEDEGEPAQAELVHVDVLCDYLLRAAMAPKLRPCYNLSAGHPVLTRDALHHLLMQLNLPVPDATVPLRRAMWFARALECMWRIARLPGIPPVTRFGVAVFGYSATLNVDAMRADFGEPSIPFTHSFDSFLHHAKGNIPC